MSRRDSKGRFVSCGNKSNRNSGKCTCKEAKKSMRSKRMSLRKGVEIGDNYITIYTTPYEDNPFIKYKEKVAQNYPGITTTNEEFEEYSEDCEPKVVICFGSDPCEDDPDAPKPVWAEGTEIIHIDPESKSTWVERPETRRETKAAEHFRRLKEASDKMSRAEKCACDEDRYEIPERLKEFLDFLDWIAKHTC